MSNLTWRERLADWISGGALTRATIKQNGSQERMLLWQNAAEDAICALRDIIAMQTPNMAHIGKRMAKRAQDALEGKP
jgi:hypothetical protein